MERRQPTPDPVSARRLRQSEASAWPRGPLHLKPQPITHTPVHMTRTLRCTDSVAWDSLQLHAALVGSAAFRVHRLSSPEDTGCSGHGCGRGRKADELPWLEIKLNADRWTWVSGVSNAGETGGNRSEGPNRPLTGPKGVAEGRLCACRCASPADLLSPHVQQQIRGRQAEDHAVHAEAAGIGHEQHSLKREGVEALRGLASPLKGRPSPCTANYKHVCLLKIVA